MIGREHSRNPGESASSTHFDTDADPPVISHASAPVSELSGFQQLAPQYIAFERRTGYVLVLVLAIVIVAATSPTLVFAVSRWWLGLLIIAAWLLLIGCLAAWAHCWPPVKYRHARWKLDSTGIEIQRGVLWRHRVSVPVARVQHVDVSQGPVQRWFKLGTITIHTAGTSNATVELEGLEYEVAVELRDHLIQQKELRDVT